MLTLSRTRWETTDLDGLDFGIGVEGFLRTIDPGRIGAMVEPHGVTASIRPEEARR